MSPPLMGVYYVEVGELHNHWARGKEVGVHCLQLKKKINEFIVQNTDGQ